MSQSNEKILIVAGSPGNRQVFVSELTRRGYKTLAAHDGKEAQSMIVWESPDLVLLNTSLPDMDVADLIKPGQKNTIAIRVLNPADIGGLFRRGFFWSPKQ